MIVYLATARADRELVEIYAIDAYLDTLDYHESLREIMAAHVRLILCTWLSMDFLHKVYYREQSKCLKCSFWPS